MNYIGKDFFPEEIENIFFEIFLPKTKPITVGIIHQPSNQSDFQQTLKENFTKLDTLKELDILGDFNTNVHQNRNHAGCKSNTHMSGKVLMVSRTIFNFAKFLAEHK